MWQSFTGQKANLPLCVRLLLPLKVNHALPITELSEGSDKNGGAAHITLGISTGEASMMSHLPFLIIDAKVKGRVLIILKIVQFLHEHKTQGM